MCGRYQDPEVKKGILYINKNADSLEKEGSRFSFYGYYYTTQAMYQARDSEAWNEWYEKSCRRLIGRQAAGHGNFGGGKYIVAQTSMAILAMGLPFRYLPVYQR